MTQPEQQNKAKADAGNFQDLLLLDRIYKDPLAAFLHKPQPINELKDECLVFLDTNVLLIPYSTSKDSLKSFTDIYKKLSESGRLYLADRVMQEFEKNVPDQLKNIFHNLVLGQNYNSQFIDFPLLDGMEEYAALKSAETALREKLDAYRIATRATLQAIERWDHNDPVRTIYRSVFAKAQRAEIISLKPNELLAQWSYRLEHKIPPGYKDSGKSDAGIGDYLLWQAVLDTCAREKKNAIVVSSDAKPDWWHKTDSQTLYARRELVEEFRAATGGNTVRLLSPSDFLKLFGANKAIVDEVAQEQANNDNPIPIRKLDFRSSFNAATSAQRWLFRNAKGRFESGDRSEVILRTGAGTHEFKFKHFLSPDAGIKILENYGSEVPVATFHTLVLIAARDRSAARLLGKIAEQNFGFNIILGHISDEEFIPVYFSNTEQINNLSLASETD